MIKNTVIMEITIKIIFFLQTKVNNAKKSKPHFIYLPLLFKLNLFSWTENRERGEDRWFTDMVRWSLGDLLLAGCDTAPDGGDPRSSKLCDLPWFLLMAEGFPCMLKFNNDTLLSQIWALNTLTKKPPSLTLRFLFPFSG